jgi:phage head maturation protease
MNKLSEKQQQKVDDISVIFGIIESQKLSEYKVMTIPNSEDSTIKVLYDGRCFSKDFLMAINEELKHRYWSVSIYEGQLELMVYDQDYEELG